MILAIDPGPTESAYSYIEPQERAPWSGGKHPNEHLLKLLLDNFWTPDFVAIEMVSSYGMAVGAEVFETCVWIGRFQQVLLNWGVPVELVYRRDVKLHHCGDARAKDANITQALRDRFAKGQPNYGKGTKAEPGWFHGFAADVWQAYALAVYAADTQYRRLSGPPDQIGRPTKEATKWTT